MKSKTLWMLALGPSTLLASWLCNAQVAPCPPPALSVDGGSTVNTACALSETLSSKYPRDNGLANDAAVIWYENFEQESIAAVTGRYSDFSNAGGMTFSSDRPSLSGGTKSIRMTSNGSPESSNATHLFKNLANGAGGYEEFYTRYYVKYQGGVPWAHSGMWIGGYNPAINWPNPQAGLKPNGNDRFSIAFEAWNHGSNVQLDFYNYWMNMHSWMDSPSGSQAYYGNSMLHDPSVRGTDNTWLCVELKVKLNTDTSSSSGAEIALWVNDELKQRYTNTSPQGYWVRQKFCPATSTDTDCTDYRGTNPQLAPLDLQLRSTSALKLNYVWLQNYITDAGGGSLWFDDVVVAKQRIGCIK